MNIYPYVYRLDHPVTGEFYIGFRYANKVPSSEDIGHKYFTSSDVVKPRFNEFTITIIAELFDKDAAYELEQQLIYENWGTIGLLNKQHRYGKGKFIHESHSDESKNKMSKSLKGRTAWNKGAKMSKDFCDNLSKIRKGKPTTLGKKFPNQCGVDNVMNNPEVKAKMSKIATGRKIAYREDGTRYWVYPTTSVSEQVGTISESNCV